jgi:heat shock protein 4
VQEQEKTELLAGLQEAEDWLYSEDGEDATKSQYVERLDKLKVMGDPIQLRWKESEDRPKAAAELREVTNTFLSAAQSGDEKYSHLSQEDLDKVVSKNLNSAD